MRITSSALLIVLIISIGACDNISSNEKPSLNLATDSDFHRLNQVVLSRSSNQVLSSGKQASKLVEALMQDPEVKRIAAILAARYPDLSPETASKHLAEYRAYTFKSADTSGKAEACPQQNLCLASVASMGVVMMAGCSAITAGLGAVACGVAVMGWVAAESALCAYECEEMAARTGNLEFNRLFERRFEQIHHVLS